MTSTLPRDTSAPIRHSVTTRLFHATLAIAIIVQLLTSLGMEMPEEGHLGNALFSVHEYSGLTAFALALLFWISVMVRRQGTKIGALFPWFSPRRRAALLEDVATHLRAALQFRLPPHDATAAFPSAVHGLGLLLMTVMAATGTAYYFLAVPGAEETQATELVLGVHTLLANLVWAYLIGHAALAMLHHVTRSLPLTTMWSLRG